MISGAVNTSALLRMLYSSALAGVGVTLIFSLTVMGAIRAGDMRRAGRGGAATAYVVLAGLGLLLSAGIVVYGLILVTQKG